MNVAYGDASALVKRYLQEDGSELVDRVDGWVTSSISAVEVSGAIWRRVRLHELRPGDAAVLAGQAAADLTAGSPSTVLVPPHDAVLETAMRLTGTDGLRAYDAVQLATAITAREAYPDLVRFACFDEQLCTAAAAHGFTLLTI